MTNNERCKMYHGTYLCEALKCICKTCKHRANQKIDEDILISSGFCGDLYKSDGFCCNVKCFAHIDWLDTIVK